MQKPVALVIGNWRYKKSSGFDEIKAVKNDVHVMINLLKMVGFKVIDIKNRTLSDLSKELGIALKSVQESPLLFY